MIALSDEFRDWCRKRWAARDRLRTPENEDIARRLALDETLKRLTGEDSPEKRMVGSRLVLQQSR